MLKTFTACVNKEGSLFVSQCLEVDVASQGETRESTYQNLQEALELHFENPIATVFLEVSEVEADVSVA